MKPGKLQLISCMSSMAMSPLTLNDLWPRNFNWNKQTPV